MAVARIPASAALTGSSVDPLRRPIGQQQSGERFRARYMFAGTVFAGMPLPSQWYEAGVAVSADDPAALATAMGVPAEAFTSTFARFNQSAASGIDADFHRGDSAYDRYYGDPTVTPNPNLLPLSGALYAVKVVLSDLGTCGGRSPTATPGCCAPTGRRSRGCTPSATVPRTPSATAIPGPVPSSARGWCSA